MRISAPNPTAPSACSSTDMAAAASDLGERVEAAGIAMTEIRETVEVTRCMVRHALAGANAEGVTLDKTTVGGLLFLVDFLHERTARSEEVIGGLFASL